VGVGSAVYLQLGELCCWTAETLLACGRVRATLQALLLGPICCVASPPPGLQRLAMRDSSKEAVRALLLAAMGERQAGSASSRSPQQCAAVQAALQPAVVLAQMVLTQARRLAPAGS
jgi:hypothetical protein